MKSLPVFIIRNHVFSSLLFGGIFVFGIMAVFAGEAELLPSLQIPRITVVMKYNSASAEEMEKLVTARVEDAVSTLDGLRSSRSIVFSDSSITEFSFNWGSDLNRLFIETRKNLDHIKNLLPRECSAPGISGFRSGTEMTMFIAAENEGMSEREFELEIRDITDLLKRTKGCATVTAEGQPENEIAVIIAAEALRAHNLDISTISRAIGNQNVSAPAGRIIRGDKEYQVRTSAYLENIHDLKKLPLQSGGNLRLGDIAEIKYQPAKRESYARVNGESIVLFSILREGNAGTRQICRDITERINHLNKRYKGRMNLRIVESQGDRINRSIRQLISAIIGGIVLGALVLYLFFKNIRVVLLIICSIPLSFLIIFLLMYIFDIGINIITLGAMALGSGMLLDSSIIVVNILWYNKTAPGRSNIAGWTAERVKEIQPALLSSTITSLAVFIPVLFIRGLISEIFSHLAIVMIFSLISSFMISITFIPLVYYLSGGNIGKGRKIKNKESRFSRFMINRAYQNSRLAGFSRLAVLTAVISLLFLFVPVRNILPFNDTGIMEIDVRFPGDYSLEANEQAAQYLEDLLLVEKKIHRLSIRGGKRETSFSERDIYNGRNTLNLRLAYKGPYQKMESVILSLLNQRFRGEYPGVKYRASPVLTPFAAVLQNDKSEGLIFSGLERKKLENYCRKVLAVPDDLTLQDRTIELSLDNQKAAAVGISPEYTAGELASFIEGDMQNYLLKDDDLIRIRVKGRGQYPETPLISGNGSTCKAESLLSRKEKRTKKYLMRMNGEAIRKVPRSYLCGIENNESLLEHSSISIFSEIFRKMVGSGQNDKKNIGGTDLKWQQEAIRSNLRIISENSVQELRRSLRNFILVFLTAVFLIYLTLAVQFQSYLVPLKIMLNILPAAVSGIFFLYLTGGTLNIFTGIGLIILCGIVVNNAILYYEQYSKTGSLKKSVKNRFFSINATTFTSIITLLPVIIFSQGNEYNGTAATVLAGGMLVSWLWSLLVFPALVKEK